MLPRAGKSAGRIMLPSSLDMVETSILAAALEAVDRVGPYDAKIRVEKIEDTRSVKRRAVVDRAKELLKSLLMTEIPESKEISEMVRQEVKIAEIGEYGPEKLPSGPGMQNQEAIIVVEGRADVLNLLKHGIKNAVATSGTALTAEHLGVLRRLADELILSFDSDEAGQAAAERAIDLAGANDFSVKLLVIDDSKLKDPADVVRNKSGAISEMAKSAKSAMEYYFYKYIKNISPDQKLKKHNIRIVLSKIKNLSSAIDRGHYLKELANILNIDEKFLNEEMESLQAGYSEKKFVVGANELKDESLSRRDLIAQRILGILLHKNDFKKAEDYLQYFPEKYAEIYKNISGVNQEGGPLDEFMDTISLRFSFENQNLDEGKLEKEFKMLERELKIEYLKGKQREKGELVSQFEKSGDEKRAQEARQEFDAVSKELYTIKTSR